MKLLRDLLTIREGFDDLDEMSDGELIRLCRDAGMEKMCVRDADGGLANREEVINTLRNEGDFDQPEYHEPPEDMDGDHASALASAGWGTDEDYGDFGGGLEDEESPETKREQAAYLKHRTAVRAAAIRRERMGESVKVGVKSSANPKAGMPKHGGLQKDVKNKAFKKEQAEKQDLKGMRTKDRPFVKAPRFREWLAGNMYFDLPDSGERAGDMENVKESVDEHKGLFVVFYKVAGSRSSGSYLVRAADAKAAKAVVQRFDPDYAQLRVMSVSAGAREYGESAQDFLASIKVPKKEGTATHIESGT